VAKSSRARGKGGRRKVLSGGRPNQRMKQTWAAILVSRGVNVLQAAQAAYPYRSRAEDHTCRDGPKENLGRA
jgi:hypothetical protein